MEQFEFLVNDYNLSYKKQEFKNAFLTHGTAYTHSYANQSGCFTIMDFPVKGELEFYYSKELHENLKDLCEKPIDVFSVEKEIWKKNSKTGFFKFHFSYWSSQKTLCVLAKVIQSCINKHGEFFGIKV